MQSGRSLNADSTIKILACVACQSPVPVALGKSLLKRHYEALAATAVAFIKLAMIRIMLRRLANPSVTA